jgi:multidrug efflux system outer membrane protein
MKHSVRSENTQQKKHGIATAIFCSLLLFLPSCRIPCLRDAEPGPDLPESFNGRATLENSAELTVPEFFNDPVLANLIDQALVGNQQLKILAEDIQIANNEILARKGAYFPFFSVAGPGASLNKYSNYSLLGADNTQNLTPYGSHFPSPLPDFMIGTEVSWQIDIWRKLRNARDAAALRYLGTTEGRNYVVTRLVADVAQNYYKLMALDKRLENLDSIIKLQEDSLGIAKSLKDAARVTELPVQRFIAELRKNNSEKLIIHQEIIETENAINFLVGRYPMPVERMTTKFIDLEMSALNVGIPSQLLQNRPDIRQAELELSACGLDVKVARARFYPSLTITGGVGVEAFNPRYLFFTPQSLVGGVAGNIVAPLINRAAIKADYMSANAKQLQAVINYQRVVLNAFTEVINRVSMVENYGKSIEIKKQQLEALVASVDVASLLFQNARTEYLDVLFAQRDLMDARMVLIETKRMQVTAVVNTYQALGGGGGGLLPIFSNETVDVSPDASPIETRENAAVPPEPLPEPLPEPKS